MKLKILGSGCKKCEALAKNAVIAAKALGTNWTLEKITDVNGIIDAGVMRTPALVVEDRIVVEGKVATADEIRERLVQLPELRSDAN